MAELYVVAMTTSVAVCSVDLLHLWAWYTVTCCFEVELYVVAMTTSVAVCSVDLLHVWAWYTVTCCLVGRAVHMHCCYVSKCVHGTLRQWGSCVDAVGNVVTVTANECML